MPVSVACWRAVELAVRARRCRGGVVAVCRRARLSVDPVPLPPLPWWSRPPSVRPGGRGGCLCAGAPRAPALLGPLLPRCRRCPPRRGSLDGFPTGPTSVAAPSHGLPKTSNPAQPVMPRTSNITNTYS